MPSQGDRKDRHIGINRRSQPITTRRGEGGGAARGGPLWSPVVPCLYPPQGLTTLRAGDHKGPLHPSTPPSPLRIIRPTACLRGFSIPSAEAYWPIFNTPYTCSPYMYIPKLHTYCTLKTARELPASCAAHKQQSHRYGSASSQCCPTPQARHAF